MFQILACILTITKYFLLGKGSLLSWIIAVAQAVVVSAWAVSLGEYLMGGTYLFLFFIDIWAFFTWKNKGAKWF